MPKTPMKMKSQKKPASKRNKMQGYAEGGKVGIKPTNQTTTTARGMGAATKGGNFKV